ncbi:MAG: hypothetical protein KJ550_02265 [Proteobacteria bacterium]|nr:hypothetical protein [Desulfobacteraceae bacterium]MBU4012272.1 hypothetical protein [Pseudomonadota bacterium]MBU4067813.1 hypothetical protein [Pseudomonadota bacterium]
MRTVLILASILVALTASCKICYSESAVTARQLQKMAGEINATLPLQLDSEMVLYRVVAYDNKELVYQIQTISVNASDIDFNIVKKLMRPKIKNSLCTMPDTLAFLRMGIIYTYSFHDKNNYYMGKFSITPKDCGF